MGRRAHVQDEGKFTEFMQNVPEDARNTGYWLIWKDGIGKTGGVIREGCGHLAFDPTETHANLRQRVFDTFINRDDGHGHGDYNASPCDSNKKELKSLPIVKFSYKEEECPMANGALPNKESNPFDDVKKVQNDLLAMKAREAQSKLMEKMLKGDEEDQVTTKGNGDFGGGMQDMLMYKMMMGDDNKKANDGAAVAIQEKLLDAKLESKMSEIKALVAEGKPKESPLEKILLEKLTQEPKGNDRFEKLLEQMIQKEQAQKQENAFQSMLAMMVQQQAGRDKEREAEDRRRDEERKEERQRQENDRKAEAIRLEAENRRREDERKAELARLEEDRKLEREKFFREMEDRQKRFDAELSIRREEIKSESAKAKEYVLEQQKMQHQLFSIFKDNKDSSLDITSKIVDTLTGAGLASMKTAQQAAESIMSIAKRVDKDDKEDKEEDGLGSILKTLAPLAGPLLAPYADADAKMKMLQSVGKIAGAGGLEALMGGLGGMPSGMPAPRMEAPAPRPSPGPKASKSEGMPMIAKYLQSFPILKDALIGNMADGLGVDLYLPILLGLDQPALEGLIANVPPQVVMNEVKRVCTPQEAVLVDQNAQWFKELRQAMIDELTGDQEDESAPPAPAGPTAQAPAPAGGPPKA